MRISLNGAKNRSLNFHQTIDFRRTFNENILKKIVVVKTQLKKREKKLFFSIFDFRFSFSLRSSIDVPFVYDHVNCTTIERHTMKLRAKILRSRKETNLFSMKNFHRPSTFDKCPIAEFRSTSSS